MTDEVRVARGGEWEISGRQLANARDMHGVVAPYGTVRVQRALSMNQLPAE
jgi:hypothetical protein